MKTIGILGGMSWESTVSYYQIINTVVRERRGGLHSAKCVLYSVDFEEIEACQKKGDWQKSAYILSDAAGSLEWAGADFVVIATNTMHKVCDDIQKNLSIPILHIADATADRLLEKNKKQVALLGTKYTMEEDFYKSRLQQRGIEVLIPEEKDRQVIHDVIFQELCMGIVREESKQSYLQIINKLVARGAEGVVLGCTEIGLLIKQEDTEVPLFDTTMIHAENAALFALED